VIGTARLAWLAGSVTVAEVKRYGKVVSPDAVRALYGTMLHEKAQAAMMLTTSWFTASSKQFVEGKPIKLVEGSELLDMMREHLGLHLYSSVRHPPRPGSK
jgi:restriction system protein